MGTKQKSKFQNHRKVRIRVIPSFLAFVSILGLGLVQGGCSLTQTRPVQEMSNAEIAIHAAKELNADSLVPDTFRLASDHYFKAKKEYRLKNFEQAKQHALKATKLAEQAEFDAYRLGGATPEVNSALAAPEGASIDPEKAFKEHESPPIEELPPSEPPPGGQTGPAALPSPTPRQMTIEYPATVTFPEKIVPQVSSLPTLNKTQTPPTKTVVKDADFLRQQNTESEEYKKNSPEFSEIPNLEAGPLLDFSTKPIESGDLPDLATTGIPEMKGNQNE